MFCYAKKRSYGKKRTEELSNIYELLQCAGCEDIRLRHTSEHLDVKGKLVPTITYYPPATFRREPDWVSGIVFRVKYGRGHWIVVKSLPDFVSRLVEEIYTALHGECLSLAAMGVRALLERVMIDCIGDQGTFTRNLTAFQEQGYISSRQKNVLEATLEVGHASIHRGFTPTPDDIIHVLDITENIIEMIYVSSEQAAHIKKRIPPRKRGA